MPNRKQDNRLAELATLAQLYSAFSRPQESQQGNQQQMALGMLGLMQQGQHQDAVLGETQANRQGDEAYHSQVLQQQAQDRMLQQNHLDAALAEQTRAHNDQSGQFWGGELPAKYAEQALQKEHYQNEDNMRAKADEQASLRAALEAYTRTPGASTEGYSRLAERAGIPGFAQFNQENTQALTNSNVSAMETALGPIYQGFQKNPKTAQAGLDAAWSGFPAMKSPAVQADPGFQSWLQNQNAALAPAQAPMTAPSAPSSPPLASADPAFAGSSLPPGQHGFDWGRLGHLLKSFGGILQDPATASPDQKAQWEQQRQAMELLRQQRQ